MARLIIIDGYNIIYNWPELKAISDEKMELARENLIEKLNNYAAYTGDEVKLVFDGHLVKKGKGSKQRIGEVEVIFTRSGKTADETIEKMIQKAHTETYVVTGDETEQWVIFGRGAWRMTPQEFYKELMTALEEMKGYEEEPATGERYVFYRLDWKIREILERWRRSK